MAYPPTSPDSSAPQTPYTEPGPSNGNVSSYPSNKRAASTSLSDSETLVTKTTKTPTSCGRKNKKLVSDAYRRRKKKKKLSITQIRPQISRVSLAKVSMSPKGKDREVKEEDNQSEDTKKNLVSADTNDELVQLRKKVEVQSVLLSAHKEFLESLSPSITCQICLDPMYRPYTLAPCGHTACYDCLLAWFRAPPAHVGHPPPQHLAFNFDPNEPTLLARDAPMLLRKDKTCPHCRAIVRDVPVEAWGIKDIVNHLFAHKGDVAKDLFPTHAGSQEERTSPSGPDAWKGVFRSGRTNRRLAILNGNRDGQVASILDDDSQHGNVRPFYDEEDDVYRCTDCYHEIWQGICSSCGRLYPGHRDEFEDDDEELDGGNWMDAEDFHGLDGQQIELADGDADGRVQGIMGALGFHRRLFHRGDEYDSADDDDYESSFIDDEDDHARMEEYHSAEEARGYDSEDIEMRYVDDEDHLPRRVPPPRVQESDEDASPRVRLGTIEILDSDSDSPVPPANRLRTQASRIRIESDDDDENTGARPQRARRVIGPSRGRQITINDSDSEQEEDERSDVGNRRNQRHHRSYTRSLSDEESVSGDGSDHSSRHGSFHGSASGLSHENYENYTFSDEEEEFMWSD
ncbi:PSH1 [Sanghuangporus vaninii]